MWRAHMKQNTAASMSKSVGTPLEEELADVQVKGERSFAALQTRADMNRGMIYDLGRHCTFLQ